MGFVHHCVYLSSHFHMILEIRQYPKVTVTAVAYILFVLSVLSPGTNEPNRAEDTQWWAGRESNPDLQLRTLPCCSVTLPTLWKSRRESNRISSLGPKRHHALDHTSLTNVEGLQRIEL